MSDSKHIIKKLINSSRIIKGLIREEKEYLIKSEFKKLEAVTGKKLEEMANMNVLYSSLEGNLDLDVEYMKKFYELNKENQANNQSNAIMLGGLIESNKKLINLITGKKNMPAYSKKGKVNSGSPAIIGRA
jgi:flagellar biosynthesis/type III secretory pathway chaperone